MNHAHDSTQSGQRQRNLYRPSQTEPFKLSRSRIENFVQCPRCFYLDRRLGVEPPSGPPFNINSAVDLLLKKEFDEYRELGRPHPVMEAFGVSAVPLKHEKMDTWRNAFQGIQYLHEETGLLVFGGVDDLWVSPEGKWIVVDYKATSINGTVSLEDAWKSAYKRQMEIYQWLFKKNNFPVSDTGYFVYCNGIRSRSRFDNRVEFDTVVLPYEGNSDWVEGALKKIFKCLNSETIPKASETCGFCRYRQAAKRCEG